MTAPQFGKLKWIELAIVVLLTATAVWYFFFRSDDATRVRARLREAVEFAEKQPKGSGFNLQNAGASYSVGDFFAEATDVEISGQSGGQIYTFGANSRAQVISSYFVMRPLLASLSVSLAEIDVEFTDESHKTATVKCSAMASGMTVAGDHYREGRLISAELIYDDGDWRFTKLRAEPVVSFSLGPEPEP